MTRSLATNLVRHRRLKRLLRLQNRLRLAIFAHIDAGKGDKAQRVRDRVFNAIKELRK